uniref:Nucelotide kinase n=1 Tax=Siphoviridae sp. ctJgf18 TaxID=2825435 RepID=A0A8S5UVU8_9CAUD|nr:MAG TPA: nucelotide kinase [Siphoviridae sp. ctJgf18]
MNTLENVKQWFIDRDIENGGRLDKQSLKLSEEFGELCAGYLKKNEQLMKDSIGDCAVVIVGLALLIKEDVNQIFKESENISKKDVLDCFNLMNANISEFQLSQNLASKEMCRHNLVRCIGYLKNLVYDFDECFEMAYQEIKDRKGRWIDGSFVKDEDYFISDNVNKPSHYQGSKGLESIEVIDNFIGNLIGKAAWCWGNTIKYLLRFQKKNGIEDLKKARKNLDWLIEEQKHEN